jgi:hypothetical protein
MTSTDRAAAQRVIDDVAHEGRRRDAEELMAFIAEITGEEPKVWNANTIGYGQYHYRYKTGQEGDFFTVGFSPRKDRITLYVMSGLRGFDDILDRLGAHKTGKSTVYLNRLGDVDRVVLAELISECVAHIEAVERSMGAIPRMSDIPPRTPPVVGD